MSDSSRPVNPDSPHARRAFLARVAKLSALAAAGSGFAQRALAQAAAPPVDPPGTVSNAQVLAGKWEGFVVHTARPLNGSIPAEYHDFDVTPTDRMYIRNNLLVPDVDAAKHVLRVRGLVDKPLDIPLAELKKMPAFTAQGMVECAGSGRRTRACPTPTRGCLWSGCSPASSGSRGQSSKESAARSDSYPIIIEAFEVQPCSSSVPATFCRPKSPRGRSTPGVGNS